MHVINNFKLSELIRQENQKIFM